MNDTTAQKSNKGRSTLRSALVIGTTTCVVFLLLFLVVELAVRQIGPRIVVEPGAHAALQAFLRGATASLVAMPRFTTDAHGFQVASPETPGTNAEGYRTPDFSEPAEGRKTLLLLGDSFTWGETARPHRLAFSDRVRAAGYKTINLGMPATGPTQYEAQARRYVPALKPDAVCVFFYPDNDFEPEGPIAPGRTRCYETEFGMVFATADDGRQLTLEEIFGWRSEGRPAWMAPVGTLLWQTATGRLLLASSSTAETKAPNVDKILGQLRGIRDVCAENDIEMMLFIVPTRPSRLGQYNTVEFASGAFSELAPMVPEGIVEADYRPAPDNHFNNVGHEKMAAFVLEKLAATGMAPLPGAGPPDFALYLVPQSPTMEEVATALGLSATQQAHATAILNTTHLRITGSYFREPLGGGTSPGQSLAGLQGAEAVRAAAASAAFGDLVDNQGPIAVHTYRDVAESYLIEGFRAICTQLSPEQVLRLKQIPLERFAVIRTGNDALAAKVASLANPGATMPWDELVTALALSPEQAAVLQAELNGLKDDLAEVFSRPPAGGGASPLQFLASEELAGLAPAERERRMQEYAATHNDSETGKPYLHVHAAAGERRYAAISAALRPEQAEAYLGLPIANFSCVDTGYDPVGQRTRELTAGDAEGGPMTWAVFAAALSLREEQATPIKDALNALKDANVAALSRTPVSGALSPVEVLRGALREGAPDAFARFIATAQTEKDPDTGRPYVEGMQRAEAQARNTILGLIDEAQRAQFQSLTGMSLADIVTGHDPMAAALR